MSRTIQFTYKTSRSKRPAKLEVSLNGMNKIQQNLITEVQQEEATTASIKSKSEM
jgi:hypothetical protein